MTTKTEDNVKARTESEAAVDVLIKSAKSTQHSCDALRFSQAALNVANALHCMATKPATVTAS